MEGNVNNSLTENLAHKLVIESLQDLKRQVCEGETRHYMSNRIDLSLSWICILTVLVLGYINYRVIKIVGTKDIQLVLMLVFLKLSLISNAVFYHFNSSIAKGYICNYNHHYYCMLAVFSPSGAELLSVAVLINISKWVYFTFYIIALAESDRPEWFQILKRKKLVLNIVTVCLSLIMFTVSVVYFGKGCRGKYTIDTFDHSYKTNV